MSGGSPKEDAQTVNKEHGKMPEITIRNKLQLTKEERITKTKKR